MDERINKLPVWAKDLLKKQERELEDLREISELMYEEGKEAQIQIDFGSTRELIGVKEAHRVRFNFDTIRFVDVYVSLHDPDELQIMASNRISITPWATNCCRIEVKK